MTGRTRRVSMTLAVALVLAIVVAGCDSSSAATGSPGDSGCDHWCGDGSATVMIGSTTTTISGGGCYDGGSAGVDARFGDWGPTGIGDYLTFIAYRTGGPTPVPAPTAPPAGPTATGHPSPNVSGSVNGSPFVLGPDSVVSLGADGHGAFSGTDLDGNGLVKGTFICG